MNGASTTRRRRARNIAIGASILAHMAILAIIGLNVPKPVYREPPSLPSANIWLMPRLTPQSHETSARSARTAPTAPLPSVPKTAAPKPISSPLASASSAPAPHASSSVAPGTPTLAEPGAATGYGTGVQGALRTTLGCDMGHLTHLTQEEKDRCNQHMGETAKLGPKTIDTIPPEKRAYYDAVQAAYQAMNDPRTPLDYNSEHEYHSFGHLPALGCGMKFGGSKQPPDHRSFSDKVKATGMIAIPLGPLRCGVVLPQGSWTPELGIPVP